VPEEWPARSDHFPVVTAVEVGPDMVEEPTRYNYRAADCQGSSPALPYRTLVEVSLCHQDTLDGVSCPQMDWFTLGRMTKHI